MSQCVSQLVARSCGDFVRRDRSAAIRASYWERGSGELSIKVVDDSEKNYRFFTDFLISAAKVQWPEKKLQSQVLGSLIKEDLDNSTEDKIWK